MAAVKKTAPVEPAENKPTVKVFEFTSENPFLTVASLGVQFINGKATTTDVAVARGLATIDGVELIQQ